MALALFDLDNTLLAGDSERAWCEFLIHAGLLDGDDFRAENERLYNEYLAGTLDIYESIEFQLKILTEYPPEELRRWREEFMASCIEPMITSAAGALVEKHRAAGDELAIVTASNSFVSRPIAERFRISTLHAIELERVGDRYTGRVLGTPTFREGKVIRLLEWLQETGETLEGSYFYSDSHNDLPLLQWVENPVAVDPDPILRVIAEAVRWPILYLHGAALYPASVSLHPLVVRR
jgi:HAD superfamily hydrolase (TIGR01490 family)